MSKNDTYLLTGNTYPHRDKIKSIGGKWDADKKGWVVAAGNMRQRATQSAVIHSLKSQGVTVSTI